MSGKCSSCEKSASNNHKCIACDEPCHVIPQCNALVGGPEGYDAPALCFPCFNDGCNENYCFYTSEPVPKIAKDPEYSILDDKVNSINLHLRQFSNFS